MCTMAIVCLLQPPRSLEPSAVRTVIRVLHTGMTDVFTEIVLFYFL
jgi:hypothetical protein